ncbi:Predicted arabinose efflux permease, MFS family [Pseudobutyrivibrio sp. ACV-2]|uniref:MFS transporter n=1 Tax=Pseudobutyrivibrio sp. ACV-2 TaxID=1520801 RepID=UPI000897E2D7|nr:MFS transporter [Pseudobutyrivibrio sp. ACV-2]SEA57135.1 Predicted arabinose efflux permease, MFS family [Pseudobutyrivibrio sp. ACV-2]
MNKTKTKIGILALCAVALSYMSLSPIIASIAADFPNVDETLPQMVFTLPSFLFISCSPLCGIAMSYINKKAIAVSSLICYLVGGLFPFFFHSSIWLLLTGSAIIGLGTGLLMPLINGFIVQYFDENSRAGLMGLNAIFTALGAMIFIFIGGQLARFGWRYTYLTFLLVLVIIFIVLICLPKGEPQKAQEPSSGKKGSAFEMNRYIFGLFVIGIIYFVIQNSFNTNSSSYAIDVLGAGPSMASLITMVNTVGGIIGGMTFRGVSMKFRNQIETFALFIVSVGFIITFFVQNNLIFILGSILVGYGFAVINAAGSYLLSLNTRPETNPFTVSIYLALINLGAAVSPIVVNACAGVFGEGAPVKYLFSGIVILLVGVYSLVLNLRLGKKKI